jgi:ABC-type nickel/cobalt efflux system permease component RcnA
MTAWLLATLLGMRHALDPDHLAALSTLAVDQGGVRRGAWLGALWGVGHTAALLCVGLALALLDAELPPRLADGFELAVAVMLIGLGVRAILRALSEGGRGEVHEHEHGGARHAHPTAHRHLHLGRRTFATRSLAVGVVHGLAGSGALTVLVATELPSMAARLSYLLVFGAGSIAGMAFLSGVAGWPLAQLRHRERVGRALALATGALSAGLGAAWGTPLLARVFG